MPEKSKASEAATEAERSVKGAISEMQEAGFGSLTWLGTDWMTTMSDIGGEMMRFMADRIKEDVKTQHEILHAKDITDVQAIQTRFMKDAFDQYAAETGKLVKISHELVAKAQAKASDKT
jgi:hypothetical protein